MAEDNASIVSFSGHQAEYHPELLPRRGERTAWMLACLVGATWVVLLLRGARVSPAVPILEFFLAFSALTISLGNWIDRHTTMRLDERGVFFENGLRRVRLEWEEIQQVQVYPSNMGKKVRVIGERAHFSFRTLGEVRVQGEVKGRMGFALGEMILQHIIEKSGLTERQSTREGSYYFRK